MSSKRVIYSITDADGNSFEDEGPGVNVDLAQGTLLRQKPNTGGTMYGKLYLCRCERSHWHCDPPDENGDTRCYEQCDLYRCTEVPTQVA